MGGLYSDPDFFYKATGLFASKLAPTGDNIPTVGASLLAKAALQKLHNFRQTKKNANLAVGVSALT
jgi:hypothetical protein